MRRVLVIGSGGSGKSTFSNRLGKLLNIEVLHLDTFFWHPGWVETPKSEWQKKDEELLCRNAWIMDGNYSGTLDTRFKACDTVIFLDISRIVCVWRVLKRAIMYRNKRRPYIAEGCPERLSLEFILWIWNYPGQTRPKIVRMFESNHDQKKIIWLRSQRDIESFLEKTRNA